MFNALIILVIIYAIGVWLTSWIAYVLKEYYTPVTVFECLKAIAAVIFWPITLIVLTLKRWRENG